MSDIRRLMEECLSKHRYQHVLGVEQTCVEMAKCHGVDVKKASIAGLLHDCAKCLTPDELLSVAREHGIEILPIEEKNPYLLHDRVGAILAKERYGIEDREILEAIACHTVGRENMTLLDKILYVADYIEPGRDKAPNLDMLRELARNDLDQCVALIMNQIYEYLKSSGAEILPDTEKLIEIYSGNRSYKMDHSKEMVKLAIEALEEKKAEDISIIDIREVSVMADYFLIAGGTNRTQIQTLCDNVQEKLGRAGYLAKQTEGYDTANWILIDFGDIIVHIFDKENRLLYDLERIWRDGKHMEPSDF